jgi:hypothetical protein
MAPVSGSAAGSFEQEPVHERTDEPGVLCRVASQHLVEPSRDAVQVLVSFGQRSGMDEHLTDVLLVTAGRQLVQ